MTTATETAPAATAATSNDRKPYVVAYGTFSRWEGGARVSKYELDRLSDDERASAGRFVMYDSSDRSCNVILLTEEEANKLNGDGSRLPKFVPYSPVEVSADADTNEIHEPEPEPKAKEPGSDTTIVRVPKSKRESKVQQQQTQPEPEPEPQPEPKSSDTATAPVISGDLSYLDLLPAEDIELILAEASTVEEVTALRNYELQHKSREAVLKAASDRINEIIG